MMLPQINASSGIRDQISEFRGYNNNERCGESEAYDECGISSDFYPLLTPREKRVLFEADVDKLVGLHANNGLIEIKKDASTGNENTLFYNGVKIGTLPGTGRRQMVSMGAYVIIYPDKYRFNTTNSTLEPLGANFTTSSQVTFTPCTLEGVTINATASSTAPTNPSNGQYWIDTSVTPNELKQWSSSQGMWNAIAASYTKIEATGIGQSFNKLDVVKISGVTGPYADTFNVDMCIWDRSDNQIIVTALINDVFYNTGITLNREPPDLDFLCEHNNRLWGCNSSKHEIYCCKLGDPTNWTSYLGTAADAFAVTVGSDGDFTGCAEHGGSVVFFKENYIHKLYGTAPSNFQLDTKPDRGVKKGCAGSIVLISGILYYISPDGACRYEGSFPTLISDALGSESYSDAVAGGWRDKYFVAMTRDSENKRNLYTFDIRAGQWHIEDKDIDYDFFVEYKNRLIFNSGNKLLSENQDTKIGGVTYPLDSTPIVWSRTFGISGIDTPFNKYISQFVIRLAMELDATLKIEIEYDSSGEWEKVAEYVNKYAVSRRDTRSYTKLTTIELPVIPKRCDHLRLRLSGSGYSKIFSVSKKIAGGGP